jgi:hypothetical protein
MTHKAILENFSTRWIERSVREEIEGLVFQAKCYRNLDSPEKELNYILEKLLLRWNHVEQSEDLNALYKAQTRIALATYLHVNGYQDEKLTEQTVAHLTQMKNDDFGLMPSHQYKKVDKAIELLTSPPKYKKTKPGYKASITQFRKGDVIAIQHLDKYYVAVCSRVNYVNESPSLRIVNQVFDSKPKLEDIQFEFIKDAYIVSTLNYLPDIAHQYFLIGHTEVEENKGGIVCDFFKVLEDLSKIKF